MIHRDLYINQIEPFIQKPFIKVLTGIRRSGKSVILRLLKDKFKERGVEEDHIVYINFESFEWIDINDAKSLYTYIHSQIKDKDTYYILLDEIQEVKEWEKAVNGFLVDFNADIYVTGSNSKLLSSELATYLTGRTVSFTIMPLSFGEYFQFHHLSPKDEHINKRDEFVKYLRSGGFPAIHTNDYPYEAIYKIVYDIYSSVILRDTIQRNNIRNFDLLERVVKFVFDNIGNKLNAKNIADYFKSQQRKADLNTIYNYLNALEEAFIIQRVPRYDVKGKEVLQTNEKYFVSDLSLIYAVMGYKDRMIAGMLENLVYLELKRRGYNVFVGKQEEKEIDFIAIRREERIYLQVTYRLSSPSTIEREFAPLLAINDHYPKYVISMDEFFQENIEGVRHCYIADFLLDDMG
ncbi:MAG: ATP-binding protein [Parabacteroides sp.]|nr:ATP-binding protein [Parabacteroides sp.]